MKQNTKILVLFAEMALLILYSVFFVFPMSVDLTALKNQQMMEEYAAQYRLPFGNLTETIREAAILNDMLLQRIVFMLVLVILMAVSIFIMEEFDVRPGRTEVRGEKPRLI